MNARDEMTGRYLRGNAEERFWKFVDRRGEDECWEWKGSLDNCGYAMFWLSGRTLHATRAYYMMMGIEMTEGVVICHKCDNPKCVNPHHTFLGTAKDNVADKYRKGRAASQKKTKPKIHPPYSVLNEQMVREILEIKRTGKKGDLRKYALEHGITPKAVYHATSKGGWKYTKRQLAQQQRSATQ